MQLMSNGLLIFFLVCFISCKEMKAEAGNKQKDFIVTIVDHIENRRTEIYELLDPIGVTFERQSWFRVFEGPFTETKFKKQLLYKILFVDSGDTVWGGLSFRKAYTKSQKKLQVCMKDCGTDVVVDKKKYDVYSISKVYNHYTYEIYFYCPSKCYINSFYVDPE